MLNLKPYTDPMPAGVILPKIEVERKVYYDLDLDPKTSNFNLLRALCLRGVEQRQINKLKNKNEYYDRVKMELSVLQELGFVDYILLNWDVLNFCHRNEIPTGPGRGSAAGSLVLYLLKVTDIDPIKYDLFFERFVSKSRAKKITHKGIDYIDGSLCPDVDNDISYDRRSEVIEYIEKKHKGKTCKILTLNTLSSKLCIKECAKIVAGMSEEEVNEISSFIPKEFGKVANLQKAYDESDKFKKFANRNKKTFEIAKKLEGLNKNTGVHPSGIAISSCQVEQIMPMQKTNDGQLVSAYDMNDVASLMVKFDILGLRTLSVVYDTCRQLNKNIKDIDTEDENLYKNFKNIEASKGLFQIEADTNFKVCKKIEPKNLEQLSAVVAIARPGALDYLSTYSDYVKTGEFQSVNSFFDDILSYTGGIPLFQEQLMKMAVKVGFTLDESEQIRRCVTGDTRFMSKSRGWIKIDDLLKEGYKDDEFLLIDEWGNEIWKPISDIWSNGKKQVKYVEADNGMTVKASQHHQFFTDNGWKARNRLLNSDYLGITFNTNNFGQKTISSDLAVVLAGMMAEGYFVHGKMATFTNFDKGVYDQFLKSSIKVFGSDNVRQRKCGKVIGLSLLAQNVLLKYMKRGKSANKTIPEIIFRQDKNTISKFISFVFACEGTITEQELSITSKSRGLINKLQLLFCQYGIRTYTNIKKNKEYGDYHVLHVSSSMKAKYLKLFRENFSECLQEYKLKKIDKHLSKKENSCFSGPTGEDIPFNIVQKFMNQYPHVPNSLKCSSGRLYKNGTNINTNVFKKFCKKSKDSKWQQFAKGSLNFSKVKNLNKEIREVEVFDFSVDESTPFIVANGMIIHNCVGKKKIKEMATWEEKIKNKIEENNLDKSVGEVLWKVAEDSAKYSFNKSHAVSYATLSAMTAYLKFKYPKQFFLSLLKMTKHEPDSHAEIALVNQELCLFNIKLLPPDLSKSNIDFDIEGNNIRYGLNSIKGVSEKTLENLIEFRDAQQNNQTKYDVFLTAKQCGINIGVLSGLIQGGAMDSFCEKINEIPNRCRLVLEAQAFNILTEREKRNAIQLGEKFNFDILKTVQAFLVESLIGDDNKLIMKKSRFETYKKKYSSYRLIYEKNRKHLKFANWFFETKYLGYSHSTEIKKVFKNCSNLVNTLDLKSVQKNDKIKLVGVVTKCVTRKSGVGNKYMMVEVQDDFGKVNFMIVNNRTSANLDHYLNNGGKVPKENQIVFIHGSKSDNIIFGDNLSILDEKIYTKLSEIK